MPISPSRANHARTPSPPSLLRASRRQPVNPCRGAAVSANFRSPSCGIGPLRSAAFVFRRSSLGLAPRVDRGSNKAEIDLICLAIATWEAQGAAAYSGSDCDCDNVVLWVGDPRTSGYRLLSGGADGLSAASQLVSARLGIDGALSLRHLCLWFFLLSSGLLPLCGSLSVSASVSYRTAGPSPAVSASWVVVVIKVSSLPLSESFRCRPERSPYRL